LANGHPRVIKIEPVLLVSILDLSSVVTTTEAAKMILSGLVCYTVCVRKEGVKCTDTAYRSYTGGGSSLC
jgi:hypothetical protein